MKNRLLLAGIATATLLLPGFTSHSAPVPGPGGVIDAVTDFLKAMDDRDREALGAAVATQAPGEHFGFGDDTSRVRKLGGSGLSFFDVAVDGHPFRAHDREEFLDGIMGLVNTKLPMQTTILSMRADCPSGNTSFAIVEFIRSYPGQKERELAHMRATALLRHTDDGFEIYHWHASRQSAKS